MRALAVLLLAGMLCMPASAAERKPLLIYTGEKGQIICEKESQMAALMTLYTARNSRYALDIVNRPEDKWVCHVWRYIWYRVVEKPRPWLITESGDWMIVRIYIFGESFSEKGNRYYYTALPRGPE